MNRRYSWNNYKYKQHQNINLHVYHWNFLKACTEVILNLLEILRIGSCTEKNSTSTAIQYKLYCNTQAYSRTMNTILAMLE